MTTIDQAASLNAWLATVVMAPIPELKPDIEVPAFTDQELLNAVSIGKSTYKDHKTHAKLISLYDGDTGTFQFRDKEGDLVEKDCRFFGIDTAEKKPRKNKLHRNDEIAAALEAREAMLKQINKASMEVHGVEGMAYLVFHEPEKFGRELVNVYNAKGFDLNAWMIKNKYAVVYGGEKKEDYIYIKQIVNGVRHYVATLPIIEPVIITRKQHGPPADLD